MSRKISEQAVLMGSRNALVGILARAAVEPAGRPAIVILNTGIIHRVGYHRMSVSMSRALATAGYSVLRFDFSGIGDSDPRDDGLPPLESSMADIRDALDWLERDHLASRVILIGLCSGADHAVLYGHTDARVVGLVLMDPSIPTTARHYLHYIALRLMEVRSWFRVLTGRSRLIRMSMRLALYIVRLEWKSRPKPAANLASRQTIEQYYRNSVDRGIAMLAVFTQESTRQTYREQMLDALPNVPFGDRLQLEFFPGSDHTFSIEADRAKLTRLILEWVGGLSQAA